MKTILFKATGLLALLCLLAACATTQRAARYPGNCYSPYDRAKDGSSCGRRAALMRPGGY